MVSGFDFETEVFEWRGPAPFYFAAVPAEFCAEIKAAAQVLSYGWGVVPVSIELSVVTFNTSLFPKQGGYLIPLKDSVRKTVGITPGQRILLKLTLE